MGEFDLSLIREFRNRPAFYDRNSPLFKDKLYTAHEWQEISNKLGYDVSLLKDRMLQLRNRYNLEKRRLEEIRERVPDRNVESQWPLFEHLHFLSEHIRSRRSYKNLLLRSREELTSSYPPSMDAHHNTGSNDSGAWLPASNGASADAESVSYPNGMLTVKVEEPDADEGGDQMEDDETDSKASDTSAPYQQKHQRQHSGNAMMVAAAHESNALHTSIRIRRLDTMQVQSPQRHVAKRTASSKVDQRQQPAVQQLYKHHAASISNATPPPAKRPHLMSACDHKYAAFGEFISSSLLELSPTRALQLVEKFTTEMVRVLMQKNDAAAAPSTTTNNSATQQLNGNVLGQ